VECLGDADQSNSGKASRDAINKERTVCTHSEPPCGDTREQPRVQNADDNALRDKIGDDERYTANYEVAVLEEASRLRVHECEDPIGSSGPNEQLNKLSSCQDVQARGYSAPRVPQERFSRFESPERLLGMILIWHAREGTIQRAR